MYLITLFAHTHTQTHAYMHSLSVWSSSAVPLSFPADVYSMLPHALLYRALWSAPPPPSPSHGPVDAARNPSRAPSFSLVTLAAVLATRPAVLCAAPESSSSRKYMHMQNVMFIADWLSTQNKTTSLFYCFNLLHTKIFSISNTVLKRVSTLFT